MNRKLHCLACWLKDEPPHSKGMLLVLLPEVNEWVGKELGKVVTRGGPSMTGN